MTQQEYNTTAYHEFKDPLFGAKEYYEYLSDNIAAYDTQIPNQGPIADRPAAGTQDRWWLATDEPAIYYDDGNAWQKVAGTDQSGETISANKFLATTDGGPTAAVFGWDNDTNTGLYRPGSNRLGVTTGGTKAFEWDANQNAILPNGDLTDGTNVIFDAVNAWVPLAILEANSITLNGGTGLKNGSTATLGGSFSLDIEPVDFAGAFLSDDGTDALQVNLGNGVKGDGADNVMIEPADFAGYLLSDDGADNLAVDEGSISHDAIDQTTVDSADHHTKTTTLDELTDSDIIDFAANTAANLPAAGTADRIYYETDTGRVLYDNGTSWVEVGLSESQISLANLASRAHADLSDAPAEAHHSRIQVSDSGTAVLTQPTDVNFDTNLSVTDDGDGTVTVDASGDQLDHPHFLCYEDGGTYYVKNMETGSVASSGADPDVQLQYAFDNLPADSGRPVIAVRDDWTGMDTKVTSFQNSFTLDARGAYFSAAGDNIILELTHDDIRVYGGIFDGSNQTAGTSTNRCINMSGCDDVVMTDVTAQNGGYYGINVYECNFCRFVRCDANSNSRHGFHPGTDTAGRNENNEFLGCVANGNGNYGFNERHGTTDYCGNTYVACEAHNNSSVGFGVFDNAGSSTAYTVTLHGCAATGNDKNYQIEDGNHTLFGCTSNGAVTTGVEFNDRANPASAALTIEAVGCKIMDTSTTGFAWDYVNVNFEGGHIEGSYFEGGSNDAVGKFEDVTGITRADATNTVWVNQHAATALGGSAPDATGYEVGMKVEDTDNAGDLYYVYDPSVSGGATQIGT